MIDLKEKKRLWYNSKLSYSERLDKGKFYSIAGLNILLTDSEYDVILHHLKGIICFGLFNDIWIDTNGDDDYIVIELTPDEIRLIIYTEDCPDKITAICYCGQLIKLEHFDSEISAYIHKIETTTQPQKEGNKNE